jgi:Mg2+ and Co2+ transporter CorA
MEALNRQRTERGCSQLTEVFNAIAEAFVNLGRELSKAIAPLIECLNEFFEEIENEELRQTTTEQLPELPKLQRFREDLL